ncbi:MAG: hypothetical protein WDO73_36275, partial [Ignavibacteriota bacterium]
SHRPLAMRRSRPPLCELVKETARFNGKVVEVRGSVFLGRESSLLVDKSCTVTAKPIDPSTYEGRK